MSCVARLFLSVMLLLASSSVQAGARCDSVWPLWDAFARAHIQADGRVIDHVADGITTSEGQSYAMFFALVANDRTRFDHVLKWTNDNLAQGNLRLHLPSWKWGKAENGKWQVLDTNPASDAELWMAYSLFQAASFWNERAYRETAQALLNNIAKREVVDLPGEGRILLPASYGFALNATTWRLNPSYMPIQLLRYFAKVDKAGPWKEVASNAVNLISAVSRGGRVPDWALFVTGKGFYLDADMGGYTSYDAIRVYLWWGMLNPRDPAFGVLREHVTGVESFASGNRYLPERISIKTGDEEGSAPVGFTAALVPYRFVLQRHREQIPSSLGDGAGYYNYALALFGYGWLEKRFSFNLDGSLNTGWKTCLK